MRVHDVTDGPDETPVDAFAAEVIPKMAGGHREVFQGFRPARVTRAGGYTLVELMVVIIIIGVLAGIVLIASSSGSSKAEAARVLSSMEAMKAALLLYSKETISRTDPLIDLVGQGKTALIMSKASKHMDRNFDKKYFDSVSITRGEEENKIVLNLKIPANAGEVGSALRKRASESSVFSYHQEDDTIRLTIK